MPTVSHPRGGSRRATALLPGATPAQANKTSACVTRIGGNLHLCGVVDELHPSRIGHRCHTVHGLADNLRKLYGAEGQRFAAALDAFQVENVVDEPHQPV